MANTYTLIASNTLTSSAASVTFSSIPSTYTDLVLRVSARTDYADTLDNIGVQFNSDTGSTYSATRIRGNGSATASARSSSTYPLTIHAGADGSTATSSTFSNWELYIPNYTVSQNKPIASFSVQENNAALAYIHSHAGLWSNTATISSIYLYGLGNFVSGSSFYLYGIKNSQDKQWIK